MAKLFAVFGATGQQGGSIVDSVLNDAELSREYKIRAITRDINSDKAKKLAEKVEVVAGDATDTASLEKALAGVHTVFSMTTPGFGPDGFQQEYDAGKTIADVAVQSGVQYLIFSTLPSVRDISGGKYTKAANFDSKAAAEKYIRGLPIKSAFFAPGEFMENFHSFPVYNLEKESDNTWAMIRHVAPTTKSPLINTTADSGKYVGAILADPDKYEGKTFHAATALYTQEDIVNILSKATGKNVVYRQITLEEYKKKLPDFMAELFTQSLSFFEEYGCFGPGTEELVAWSVANARGKLTTFEEYLSAHPLKLE